MKLCYSCFTKYGDEFYVCPKCGHPDITGPEEPIYLAPGTILGKRYIVGEAIGAGGFGIIYKAWDSKFENIVALKEFFPSRLIRRAQGKKEISLINEKSKEEFGYRKARFLAEARTMAQYGSNKIIPNVFEFFEENGTAYIVMELLIGTTLKEYLKSQQGKVDQDFALMVTEEIGYALKALHKDGVIHRDVAPDNIYICSGKELRLKLLDFGAAKLVDKTDDVIDIVLKPGYSPYEQYDSTNNIGPWTDVYALGATLYQMLTGVVPEEASDRKKEDKVLPPHILDANIPESLSNLVMKAISLEIHMRYKNVDELLKSIKAYMNGKKIRSIKAEIFRKRVKRIAGIAAACAILGVLAFFLKKNFEKKREVEYLDKAELTVWSCAEKGSNEDIAMQDILAQFKESYPDISFKYSCYPEDEYYEKLKTAAEKNKLPDVFESTGVSDSVLKKSRSIKTVLKSDQAKECLFLDQYSNYYDDYKQIPLGIIVPMAYVITNGVTSVDYSEEYFKTVTDLASKEEIAVDEEYGKLIKKNYGSWSWADKEDFMDNEENTVAILISTTMGMNEVRETLTNYQKQYVFPDSDKIYCDFTYEWSLGNGNKNENKAADRFLSWMLGNVYQTTLMIGRASDGQIPVNKASYLAKCEVKAYEPLASEKIYNKYVFEK
ncbi:MAG: protein kinase [Lachnospiraceae bacterium]|nr:protein kinase [Lachnospiraceae bacterium]